MYIWSPEREGRRTARSGWQAVLLLAALGGGAASAQTPAREAETGVTVRAVRVDVPLVLDGRLDEPLYEGEEAPRRLVQYEPVYRAAASDRTDVWVAFDDEHVYVGIRAWETPPEPRVADEMRRDSRNIFNNDNVTFVLDSFGDRRNGVLFALSAIGGRIDGQIANEDSLNRDWNPVWDFAVGQFDQGWTAEAAIPFKSLRYAPGTQQTWGFQVRRFRAARNELSYLSLPPIGLGRQGIFRVSAAAALTGLEVPPPARNLEVKPFVTGNLSSDLTTTPATRNDPNGDVGLDLKYGITPNLTADVTVNTDFAQVEADERQVNLTRFSLFFPEKREFFLENSGLFDVGGGNGTNDAPLLFYSRRIGLEQGGEVPIVGGGRVTGRVGEFAIGALNIQTGDVPARGLEATNFSVLRAQRNILRRSSIGALWARRSRSLHGPGASQTYAVDANLGLGDHLRVVSYWARTDTPNVGDDVASYRVFTQYDSDLIGVTANHLVIGRDFTPEVGFLARQDIQRDYLAFRYSPRPAGIAAIRQLSWQQSLLYVEDRAGQPDTRRHELEFVATLENSDVFTATYQDFYQFLDKPFEISNGVVLPVGEYRFGTLNASYAFGGHRPVSGTLSLEQGGFWSGDRTTVAVSGGRAALGAQLSLEPSLSWNRVSLAEGDFTTTVAGVRATFTMTPRMFVSGLAQYASRDRSIGANVRFRWEYQPGSELFVVYNESRDTLGSGIPDLQSRALIVKVNRLFRF